MSSLVNLFGAHQIIAHQFVPALKIKMLRKIFPLCALAAVSAAQYVSQPYAICIEGKTNSSINGKVLLIPARHRLSIYAASC